VLHSCGFQSYLKTFRLDCKGLPSANTHKFINYSHKKFYNIGPRRSHQKAIDQLQSNLEAEAKLKAEALRTKKKLEADVQVSML
jgi:hypothetical protein